MEEAGNSGNISVRLYFRILGWILTTIVPWACVYVLCHWTWIPEWYTNIILISVGALCIVLGLLVWLFISWRLTPNNKSWRIIFLVLIPFNLFFGIFALLFNSPEYEPVTRKYDMELAGRDYTFYIQQFRGWGTLLTHDGCTRIWVRRDNERTMQALDEQVCNVALTGEPVKNGNRIRFYFDDQSFWQRQGDQYLEFDGLTGIAYRGPADTIPVR